MKITSGQTVTLSNDLNEEVIIDPGGVLIFDPNKSVKITTTKNLVNKGRIRARPANRSIIHHIQFTGIIENNFVGGGMEPIASDIGLWNMEAGVLELEGFYRERYTQAIGDLKAGATTITLQNITGWQINDEIVIAPMDTPPLTNIDWDANAKKTIDPYFEKFERRTIKSISGNTVTLNTALKFDHLIAEDLPPYVGNLTSNVIIEGTPTGRSHIFSCGHGAKLADGTTPHFPQKHHIKNILMRNLGPRRTIGTEGRSTLVLGRYGLHFHHIGNGAEGTIVESCAMYDIGNRGYVPHMSNGITMQKNLCFNSLETQFWWDWQEISHRIKWYKNLMMASRQNGIDSSCRAMILSMGNDNEAEDNIAVYCHTGDEGGAGAYTWDADNEGVWNKFKGNIAIACRSGLFVWQNSVYVHIVEGFRAINCGISMMHGAYANMYIYAGNRFFNAKTIAKASASAGNTGYENSIFNGNNQINELVEVKPSPVPSGNLPNIFRNCTFKNAKVAFLLNCDKSNPDNEMKIVDVIGCTFENISQQFTFGPGPLDSYFRVQDKAGKATKVSKSGTTTIPQFAPLSYGTGTGLTAEYYNGANFESFAFIRIDQMIYYQQWRIDTPIYPLGPNDRVKVPFSVRWTGKVEAQWTESHVFRVTGGSPYKLWVNGALTTNADSAPVNLVAGQKYDIKIEVSATNPNLLGASFYWKSPSMTRFNELPYSQLYPAGGITPPPPVVFKNIAMSKVFTRDNCGVGFTGGNYTHIVPAGRYTSTISQVDADNYAKYEMDEFGPEEANKNAVCIPITPPPPTDPCQIFVAADYLELQPDVKAAGYTLTTAINHYNTYGIKEKRRANKLCLDPLLFPKLIPIPPPVPVVEEIELTFKSGKKATYQAVGNDLKLKP